MRSWTITDPMEFSELSASFYGFQPQVEFVGDLTRFRCTVECFAAGPLLVAAVQHNLHAVADLEPVPHFLAVAPVSGAIVFTGRGGRCTAGPGRPVRYSQTDRTTKRSGDLSARVLRLDPAQIARVAAETFGTDLRPIRFTGLEPASPALAAYWTALVDLIHAQAVAAHRPLDEPLRLARTVDLAALAALTVFPNDAESGDSTRTPGRADATAVDRALQFVHEFAHLPITVTQVAEAAQVDVPSLLRSFQAQVGTELRVYLTRVRLAHAHGELLHSDPGADPQQRIDHIAARWGFLDHGELRASYRLEYGRDPSDTLHS